MSTWWTLFRWWWEVDTHTHTQTHAHTHTLSRAQNAWMFGLQHVFPYTIKEHIHANEYTRIQCAHTCMPMHTYAEKENSNYHTPAFTQRHTQFWTSTHALRDSQMLVRIKLVGSLNLYVSFAEYRLFHRSLLQKRPTILRILLIEATPQGAKDYRVWGVKFGT